MIASPPTQAVHEPAEDPRFTFGLLLDVSDVLVAHGYPEPSGLELVELGQVLYRFVRGRAWSGDAVPADASRRTLTSPQPPAAQQPTQRARQP